MSGAKRLSAAAPATQLPGNRAEESRESRRNDKRAEDPDTKGKINEPSLAATQNTAPPASEAAAEILERLKKNCREFVFPPGQKVVPKALCRMTAYCRYGPAVEGMTVDRKPRLRLPAAKSGGRALQEHEEQLVIHEEESVAVADVYCSAMPVSAHVASLRPPKSVSPSTIPEGDFGEMNTKKHPLIHQLLDLTRVELCMILDSVKPPDCIDARTNERQLESTMFNAICDALLGERHRRINVLKTAAPRLTDLRRDPEVTKRSATRFYNHTSPKAYELHGWEDPQDVLRALHRSVYQIADLESKNSPELSYNVRCLRSELEMPDGAVKEGWDNYCCVRGKADTRITTLRK